MKSSATRKRDPSDFVRARKRSELGSRFEDFLEQASPEEIWLMGDMLAYWESISTRPDERVPLARCFEDAITRSAAYYLRIEDEDTERVVVRFLAEYRRSGGRFTPSEGDWLYWHGKSQKR